MTSHTCSAPIGGELLRCTEAERTQPLTWARGGPSLATVMDVLQAVPSLENFKISPQTLTFQKPGEAQLCLHF